MKWENEFPYFQTPHTSLQYLTAIRLYNQTEEYDNLQTFLLAVLNGFVHEDEYDTNNDVFEESTGEGGVSWCWTESSRPTMWCVPSVPVHPVVAPGVCVYVHSSPAQMLDNHTDNARKTIMLWMNHEMSMMRTNLMYMMKYDMTDDGGVTLCLD